MAYPTQSERQYDYLAYQMVNPTRPLPGDKVNADFNEVDRATAAIIEFLKLFVRSDGQIKNNSIGVTQLAADALLGFNSPTLWTPGGTRYRVGVNIFYAGKFYQSIDDHVSGTTFNPAQWTLLIDFSAVAAAAEAAMLAAQAAAATAAADAVAAVDVILDGHVAAAQAARVAAELAEAHAELAEAHAETAETNAELAEAHAELAEANAEAAQAAAAASAIAAGLSQVAAASSAADAQTAENNAETAETNAEAAAAAAAGSASAANLSAITADASADAAAASAAIFDPSDYATAAQGATADAALARAGGVMTGKLSTLASATSGAGLNLPHGVAPTAPVNGDVWTTTTTVIARLNGASRTLALLQAAQSWTAKQTFLTPTTAAASITLPHGVAPTSPVNGDVWSTTGAFFGRLNSVTIEFATKAQTDAALLMDGSRTMIGPVLMTEAAAPGTPAAGTLSLYAKTDSKLYTKDDTGTETLVGSGGGGGLSDGDYGDLVVSGSGTVITFDTGVVTAAAKTVLDDTTTAAMATTLGLGTGSSPQFTAVNIGHASDTTITRTGAGDIAVEGNGIYRAGGTDAPVADGGTGRSSHTPYAVLCGGTTTTAAQQSVAAVGSSGQVLTSNGAGAWPTFQDAAGGGEPVSTGSTLAIGTTAWLTVVSGGSLASGASRAGSSLQTAVASTSGVVGSNGTAQSGTWTNFSGASISGTASGPFTRTA